MTKSFPSRWRRVGTPPNGSNCRLVTSQPKGITSTAVCPGFTVTGFHTASGVQDEMDRVPKFMKFSAKRVASEAVEATLSGKSLCVPTKTYKILVFILKHVPESVMSLFGKGLAPGRYDKK